MFEPVAHMRYKYTSFFWSRSAVAMFFSTSGNRADTSLPSVIAMIVFCIDSFLNQFSAFSQRSPDRSSTFRMHIGTCTSSVSVRHPSQDYTYTSPALNSNVSPFLGAAIALRILFIAIFLCRLQATIRLAKRSWGWIQCVCSTASSSFHGAPFRIRRRLPDGVLHLQVVLCRKRGEMSQKLAATRQQGIQECFLQFCPLALTETLLTGKVTRVVPG